MQWSREIMLERMYASDKTCDGRFLTGVTSTGIYCLPSCSARKPKAENVVFFASEVEAQAAGLRACRRCRPDRFYQGCDPDRETLQTLAAQVRSEPGEFADVGAMAAASGIGATKLHALFQKHYHVTPAVFLNRARIAAACRLLEAEDVRAIDTAFAVGYDSLSAFHENFRRGTGLTPGEYQRLGRDACFTLALPPDYLSAYTLRIHGRDAQSVSERVEGNRLEKAVHVKGKAVRLRIELETGRAHCRVEAAAKLNAEEIREAHRTVVRLLGMASDPAPFERKLDAQGDLARLLEGRRGLRVPLTGSIFEGVIWAIVGQQISLPFAYTLRRRLTELCGEDAGNRLRTPPAPRVVAALDIADLTALQFSQRKAEYLIGIAQNIVADELPIETFSEEAATQVEQRLLAVRGLGPWSAHYILMRACGFADCVPVGDTGLTSALRRFFALDHAPNAVETLERMTPFAPYRSLSTHHLWLTLNTPE